MDSKQAMWVKLPITGQVVRTLDKSGVVHVAGEDPGFAGAPYRVYLGMRERGAPLRFGILDSHEEGDYFFAEVQKKGSFDVHLKAQTLRNQTVSIEWWAIPESQTCWLGPTTTPMPTPSTPAPTGSPKGLTSLRFRASDYPGRYVNEVPGIGPRFIQRLTQGRIKSLATLASADATRIAHILRISEVRAMAFICEARLLLKKTRK